MARNNPRQRTSKGTLAKARAKRWKWKMLPIRKLDECN
jgi:DNA invertase Pin-like site-specific DNA recombinase